MAHTIIIDAEALKLVAKELKIPADTVRLAVEFFNSRVDTLGEPWGEDELGEQWSKIYRPGLVNVQASFKSIIQGLLRLSSDFEAMALRYELVEENNSR